MLMAVVVTVVTTVFVVTLAVTYVCCVRMKRKQWRKLSTDAVDLLTENSDGNMPVMADTDIRHCEKVDADLALPLMPGEGIDDFSVGVTQPV